MSKAAARKRAIELLELVRIPGAGAAHQFLSARDVRRPAPARDDRHGARQRPRPADRRRADDGARRDRPGADPGAARRPAEAARHVDRVHHPRSRHRAPLRRPRLCHEARRGGRKRRDRTTSSRRPKHPYTRMLLDAEPTGRKEPVAGERADGARSARTSRSRSRSKTGFFGKASACAARGRRRQPVGPRRGDHRHRRRVRLRQVDPRPRAPAPAAGGGHRPLRGPQPDAPRPGRHAAAAARSCRWSSRTRSARCRRA